MNSKKNNIFWAISLFAIGITAIAFAGSKLMGIELPDAAIRVMGIIDIIALPILAFTTVKKLNSNKENGGN